MFSSHIAGLHSSHVSSFVHYIQPTEKRMEPSFFFSHRRIAVHPLHHLRSSSSSHAIAVTVNIRCRRLLFCPVDSVAITALSFVAAIAYQKKTGFSGFRCFYQSLFCISVPLPHNI